MTINVSIWSDIACPWCFVGKARFEAALEALASDGQAVDMNIRWRAFELDPRPREKTNTPYVERLATKYNRSIADAQQMLDTMRDNIVKAGGECDFEALIPANTFDAHRLIQWAGDAEPVGSTGTAQHRLTDALMRSYLGHGLDLSSHAAMLDVVTDVGLDSSRAAEVLNGDEYGQTVRADEKEAQELGIHGVPFFLIDRYGVSGAQEASIFVDAIKQIQADTDQTDVAVRV